jgi:hypothetical protein
MFLWWAIAAAISPAVKVKTYWRNSNYWRLLYCITLSNIVPEWPRPDSNRFLWIGIHIRGSHKNCYGLWIGFYKIKTKNYIGAWTLDQLESIVKPMNQWGNKEGRQEIWQRTPIHRISPICFHFNLQSSKSSRPWVIWILSRDKVPLNDEI